jgi:hypothetical protein
MIVLKGPVLKPKAFSMTSCHMGKKVLRNINVSRLRRL